MSHRSSSAGTTTLAEAERQKRENGEAELRGSSAEACDSCMRRRVSRCSSSSRRLCLSPSTVLHSNLRPDSEKGRPHLCGRSIALRRGPSPGLTNPLSPLPELRHASLSSLQIASLPRLARQIPSLPCRCTALHHWTAPIQGREKKPKIDWRNLQHWGATSSASFLCLATCITTKLPSIYLFGTLMHVGF
ncbi:hypothetical protein MRB53_022190 [Persea americana]|uniref:Uncharacterized protein n=1 Tax=Persea americana TaxID=3435 RepID=A0ACC2L694_PERAE|nr:hypothetical protein MRB53_022190 [Persea americana]